MKRTTVKIPDSRDALLGHEAARRGTTISEISRETLEAYFGVRRSGAGWAQQAPATADAAMSPTVSRRSWRSWLPRLPDSPG